MLSGRNSRKAIAATLLLTFFTETFAPSISYALTSGPTQPEATSFEPVDTTDMVNMQTGDFVYNIPLLDVLGPDGSYPLSLSYHGGVQTDMDASWVGLGWTLNPGAIARSVNGFPDDWLNQLGSSHTFWSGGKTTTYSAGVNIGLAQSPFSVSFGLAISQDTYKGFGVGFNFGFGMQGMGGPSGMNSSIGVGVAPYTGKASVSYGISQNSPVFEGLNVSNGITLNTNFSTIQASASGGVGFSTGGADPVNYSLLGASISSSGNLSYSAGPAGFISNVASNKLAGVQTATNGFSLTIPLSSLVSVSLGYSKTRYWTNENSTTYIEGSYYPVGSTITPYNYDVYSLLDDPSTYNIAAFPDPTVLQGGTYPSFDDYQVTAQGLSGDMRPYGFEEALTTQSTVDANNNPLVTSAYLGQPYLNDLKCFRFENDFSNSYRQNLSNEYAAGTTETSLPTDEPPFDPNPAYGNNDGQFGISINSSVGTSVMNPALAGSRHIDVGVKVGPSHIYGYNPADQYKSGMFNGFSITNESGVTYHYGLPAYSYGEQNYQQKINTTNGLFFNRGTKNVGYAYTWYLTTITGPDYVDRNGNGIADEGDWGYWVNFEYGKWSNEYVWRNPAQGYAIDDDNNFENCSQGKKEVYYLNAIRTRSNIAIFEKDVRQDGKGVEPETFYQNSQNDQNGVLTYTNYQNAGGFDINSSQSMQLSHIYLLPIADTNFVLPNSSTNSTIYTPSGRTVPCSDCELPLNVIDANDVNQVGRYALISKAIRVIDFNYNYSLCPNTANSFNISTPSVLNGKLTLSSVVTRGVAGTNLIPPVTFGYDLAGSDIKSQAGVTLYPASGSAQAYFTTTSNIFNQGDMIMETTASPAVYCGLITGPPTLSGSLYTYTLANGNYTGSVATVNIQTTKNPPYNLNCFDGWGMYKGDADPTLLVNNANMGRATTAASAPATDAWSLRYIYSPFGDNTKINYQPDSYHTSIMNNTYSYVMQNIALVGTSGKQITFNLATYGSTANPASLLYAGEYLPNVLLAVNYAGIGPFCTGDFRQATPSSVIGGLTINSLSTSNGVTTITGTTDNIIPPAWGPHLASMLSIASGNLWINYTGDYLGGGIRVQSITANHSLDNTSSTLTYNYNNPATGYSSGVTSYTPTGLDAYDATAMNSNPTGGYCNLTDDINQYLTLLYGNVNAVYPIARELPAPGVMYQYVTVTNQIKNPDEASVRNIEGSTRYQFEVLQPGMVLRDPLPPLVYSGMNVAKSWAIRKFTAGIGSVKRITQYDVNGVMLSQTINHYLHDNLESQGLTGDNFFTPYLALIAAAPYNYQGFIQERYADVKTIAANYLSPTAPGYLQVPLGGARASLSGRESYPCILTGQTVINYVNGTQTSTSNLAFDFYSGAVTRTLETDSYGNNIMTETVPAYREYPAMGLKINVDANKNMLTQVAETKKWKVDANIDTLELATAEVTTWSDNVPVIDINGNSYTQNNAATYGDIWRLQSRYTYLSAAQTQTADGLTPLANFSDFNWTTPSSSDPGWKNISNIPLYDVYSKSLEQNDVNGNYASVHMDYGDQHVILTGSPANFYEMAFSGAEDANLTQTSNLFVNGGAGTIATVAHTGAQSLLLGTSGVKGFTYSVPTSNLVAGRTYQASVWVKAITGFPTTVGLYYDIDGTIKNTSSSANSTQTGTNNWVLVNLVINGSDITPGHTLNVWCRNDNTTIQAYVDDFRFQPQNATTTAYVYDPVSGQLDYVLDNSDVYTEYTYDGVGRLLKVIKEKVGFGIYTNNQNEYAYGASQWYNAAINGANYTKNNCPIYTTPSTTAVTVPANMFNSFFSLVDANTQAQAYAQDYANVNGTCSCAPVFSFASGITVTENQISGPAPNITYAFAFTWPTGNTTVNLGNVLGPCAYPTSTRTIPFIQGSTVYNLTVSPTGNVEVSVMSGPAPSGTWGTTGSYNINQNAYYSDPESNSFQRTNCGSGYTGSYVTYSIPQYAYNSLTSVAAADQLAINAMNAAGPTYANQYGTCSANCSFTWASGINPYSATIGSSGTTGNFSINFLPTTNGWSSGTLGTIVGSACIPTSVQTVYVTDGSNSSRTWQVTISTNGTVSVRQQSGPATTTQGAPIQLKGTYTD